MPTIPRVDGNRLKFFVFGDLFEVANPYIPGHPHDQLVSSRRAGASFPWGTLVVNVSGCFALGLLGTVLTERFLPHPHLRSAVTIGFLGAYTTFSTFAYETLRLGEEGAGRLAALNVGLSVGLDC